MNAQQAIDKIKSVRTTFFGIDVQKYNYPIQIRRQLCSMAERNEISPSVYWDALKITQPMMSEAEVASELSELEK